MSENIDSKVRTATKWSAITEIAAKLVTPIVSMVLARLLTPDAFGVVTTLAMVVSFAEIFTDAGFQKYLVQHEFRDDQDREESTTVAFWSNLVMSLIFWGIISLFNAPLAVLVGNPGLGYVLVIACVSIPLAAFSSIQGALFRRDLDFKTLFKVRIVSTIIPLAVTVPLAFWLHNYWSLVIGTIVVNLLNAFLLTYYSKWKPRLYYSFSKLKEMLSFTVWSVIEAVSIWLTGYVDVFIVGTMLSQYYLGLYKTSSTLVGQIMGLITAVTTPVLFSALSRLQNDEKEFQQFFFRFQKIVALMIMPSGVGLFIFRDLATKIILGEQWMEASGFIGLWGLTSALTIVLAHYSSEVYRAKGLPKLSVLAQLLHIVVLWPTVLISVKYGFETLYIARSLVRLELIIVNLCIMAFFIRIPINRMMANILPYCLAASCMAIVLFLPNTENLLISLMYAGLSALIYIGVIFLFPEERKTLFSLSQLLRNKKFNMSNENSNSR